MVTPSSIRHAEAYVHEERAPWIGALWIALLLLALLSLLFS